MDSHVKQSIGQSMCSGARSMHALCRCTLSVCPLAWELMKPCSFGIFMEAS